MAELKTKPTTESVSSFLGKVADKDRREDCLAVIDIMSEATGEEPTMWGTSIVGFGRYRYKYESGREGEWMMMGVSPRKSDLTLYIMPSCDSFPDLMQRLGKHKTGKSCLYIKRLSDVDLSVLRKLLKESLRKMAGQRVGK